LELFNDCGPCCDCEDYFAVWEAIRKVRDRYAELVERAQAARDLYHDNRDRWIEAAECRGDGMVRAILQASPNRETIVSVGLCNSRDECLEGVVLHISFEYLDGTGQCFNEGLDTPLKADTTAAFAQIIPGTTSRTGNVDPNNPNTGGGASQQEFYTLGGSYPHFWAYFNSISPSTMGAVSFRAGWGGDEEAVVQMIVAGFVIGPGGSVSGSTPVPGYTPGVGPIGVTDGQIVNFCPLKRSTSLMTS
jgi:hypothetical protein